MSDKMAKFGNFFKQHPGDKIWRLDTPGRVGEFWFSFDKKTAFNLFHDYPWALTAEQKELFDQENTFWADFFKDRRREDPPEDWESHEVTF